MQFMLKIKKSIIRDPHISLVQKKKCPFLLFLTITPAFCRNTKAYENYLEENICISVWLGISKCAF